jgi:dipeptidase
MEADLPENSALKPQGQYDAQSIWWQHELLHREVLKDFENRSAAVRAEQDQFERQWIEAALKNSKNSAREKMQITDQAFREAGELTQDWYEKVKRQPIARKNVFYYTSEWQTLNRKAHIPV